MTMMIIIIHSGGTIGTIDVRTIYTTFLANAIKINVSRTSHGPGKAADVRRKGRDRSHGRGSEQPRPRRLLDTSSNTSGPQQTSPCVPAAGPC